MWTGANSGESGWAKSVSTMANPPLVEPGELVAVAPGLVGRLHPSHDRRTDIVVALDARPPDFLTTKDSLQTPSSAAARKAARSMGYEFHTDFAES